MKKLNSLLIVIFFATAHLSSQTFVEWTDHGWGYGLGDCRPEIIDIDSDGLLDLFIGNYGGYISHFEQTAPNSLNFSLLKHKLNNIDVELFASPAFADLDKDGLMDMIVGEWKGNLHHYEALSAEADSFLLKTEDFDSIQVAGNASPHFTDLDQDGLLDLLIGAHSGNLYLYEQQSPASEKFLLITDSLKIDPPTFRLNPTVMDLDQNGLLDLLVGGNFGDISHFEQTEVSSIDFTAHTRRLFETNKPMYGGSAPGLHDFDNDGLFDLIVGEMDGLYYHFEQSSPLSFDFTLQTQNFLNLMDVGTGAAPCLTDLDEDGLLDLIVGEWQGNLNHYEQIEEGSMEFVLISDTLGNFDVGDYSLPALTDLDANGLIDLIVGERDGTLNHLEQDPEDPNVFKLVSENFNDIDLERFAAPCFTDLDGDGLMDMILGENIGKLHLYEQQSPQSREFVLVTDSLPVPVKEYQPTPYVVDFDDDGLLDLFVGEGNGRILHYEQLAENSLEFVAITDFFGEITVEWDARLAMGDINQDGWMDLICGDNQGGLHLFVRDTSTQAGTSVILNAATDGYALFSNYPNPFQVETHIPYQIPVACDVKFQVYNLQGKVIKSFIFKNLPAGRHVFPWDASDQKGNPIAPGSYVLQMQAEGYIHSRIISHIE